MNTLCQYCKHRQAETGYNGNRPTVVEYCELNNRFPALICNDYEPEKLDEQGRSD